MEPSSTKPEAAEAEAKPGQEPEAAVAEPTAPAAEKKEEPSGAGRDGEGAVTKATEGGEPSPKRAKVDEGGHEDGEAVKDDDANGAPGPAPTSKDPASNAKQTAEQEKKPESATVEAAGNKNHAMAANAKEAEANNNNGNNNGKSQQGVGKTGDNMGGQKRAEIYTYNAKDMVFSLAWSVRKDKKFRLAAGSFVEEYQNKVEILYLDETKGEFGLSEPALSFSHPFPATKIMFVPEKGAGGADLLATSSDYLRLYTIDDTQQGNSSVEVKSILSNSSNSEFCAPLTSFDWNEDDLNKIGTSSIDTTCTIWDLEKEVVDTQLIAHDREVYDFAWGGAGVFASVSADGSVRVFDLRDKEHSTIIYESPHPEVPLVRLGWNKQDPRYMATVLMDSSKVIILDIRFPTLPVAELQRHQASVNQLAWAPHSSCHICTAGDDAQALIWDLSSMSQPLDGSLDPILAYHAGAEINNLQWSSAQPDWVAIAFSSSVQILRV
mmetsp:Transcript_7805/g.26877  ORF Transcript_7805/g.26877 Transcript_7805/m.26877 type:complete len:493 (-) Transcript_7805:87-1565(-)